MVWVNGPLGVGKSAVAQTCAERLEKESLGAAFFFSRPNERDDPQGFFTTIASQLTTHCRPYADLLEAKIRSNPSLISKSLGVQFRELIAVPFQELRAQGMDIENERLIIIDGLDECNSDNAQCDIIRIILSSATSRTLPFCWAVFSRPEPHIESAFSTLDPASTLCWRITLPVSGASAMEDIGLYLRNGFRNIRNQTDPNWPSDEEIQQLVERSGGLFVYASVILKLFGDPDLANPESLLRDLLSRQKRSTKLWSELDIFYTLIMERIPKDTLLTTLTLLLVSEYRPAVSVTVFMFSETYRSMSLLEVSNLLGYTSRSVAAALNRLRSVLYLDSRYGPATFGQRDSRISYYHASFLEFLEDPTRSGRFCIYQSPHYTCWAERCLQIIKELSSGERSSQSSPTS